VLLTVALGAAFAVGATAFAKDDGDGSKAGSAPDPASAPSRKQWVFDISYKNKQPTIERVRAVTLAEPASTARIIGRYAIELYIGKELLDRIRFNPPLAGDGPPDKTRRPFAAPRFDDVIAHLQVQIADNPRATYVVLLDRATGASQHFWWPPEPNGTLTPMHQVATDGDGGKADANKSKP
jgi:hypothetical protein